MSGNEAAAAKVSAYLAETKCLETLRLADNCLGPVALATVLSGVIPNGSLTSVDVSENRPAAGAPDAGDLASASEKVAQLLRENKFLLSLNLGGNGFSPVHIAAFADAVAQSDTRVATPVPEPEPEVEEFKDELPPEEEAPPIAPTELPPPPQPEVDETAKGERGDAGDATSAAAGGAKHPAADDGEGDEEDGVGDADEAAASTAGVADPEPPAALDPEEEERLREEREEADKQQRLAAEESWREQMGLVVWAPQRVRFEYDEGTSRRDVLRDYMNESLALKSAEKLSKSEFKARQAARERKDRVRRSGWSHLTTLSLRGNHIGAMGCKAIASMLRYEIPIDKTALTEGAGDDDVGGRDEPARAEDGDAPAADAFPETAAIPGDDEGLDREDEEDPTDDGAAAGEAEGAPVAAEGVAPQAGNGTAAPVDEPGMDTGDGSSSLAAKPAAAPPAPPPTTKPGVQTLTSLDLADGKISARALQLLAPVLGRGCPNLRHLSLQRNTFGFKFVDEPSSQTAAADDSAPADEDDDSGAAHAKAKIADPLFSSVGVAALADSLAQNTTLTSLDLSFNGMRPMAFATFVLRGAFHNRSGLVTLRLDGNPLGDGSEVAESAAWWPSSGDHSCTTNTGEAYVPLHFLDSVFASMRDLSGLSSLHLSNIKLGQYLRTVYTTPSADDSGRRRFAASGLWFLPSTVTVLDLSHNDICPQGLEVLSEVLASEVCMLTLVSLSFEGNHRLLGGVVATNDPPREAQMLTYCHHLAGCLSRIVARHASTLRALNLGETYMRDVCVDVLFGAQDTDGSSIPTRLKSLSLRNNPALTHPANGVIANIGRMSMLQTLDLGDCDGLDAHWCQSLVLAVSESC